ncbi:thioredoxin domain-containing protein [Desulfovibrio sp. JC022]|uniref:DsbA family protein n=1 Tax=Desulfovibrio sp. JC022 TaxID=2593642 RepID=UPI0013CF98D9|nr:thioredoxin domain-containing protein [Desulfovibrio sp. JC022]NDV22281.1 disulfide bond formation protein DsbA [Desulfovibrio sp. JC022]
MLKRIMLILSVAVMFSGCVNKQMLKEQIAEAIRENPQIVLDALREKKMDMLVILEQGISEREKLKRAARLEAEIQNSFKPRIWAGRPMLGNVDAPVTIVEYSDFLCPYCSKAASVVSKLAIEQPEKYRLVFKHLPMNEKSRKLALFFEAIALFDKEKAYKFHDLVFGHQKELYEDNSGAVLAKIIDEAGVDHDLLQKSINSMQVQEYLLADEKEARAFKINATPTFLINGVVVRGYLPAERFEKKVDLILEKTTKRTTAEAQEGEACEDCLNQM